MARLEEQQDGDDSGHISSDQIVYKKMMAGGVGGDIFVDLMGL